MLVLRDAGLHRVQLGQPAGAAELAAAATDAVHSLRFVAHADVPHVHARAEEPFELPNETAEIHALFSGEVDREPLLVPLPLGVRDFQVQSERAHLLNRPRANVVFVRTLLRGTGNLVAVRGAHRLSQRIGACLAVRCASLALEREIAGGVHAAEILAAFHLDDDGSLQHRSVLEWPFEELAAVSLE